LYPILVDFGPFSLHTYGLAMAVAFGLGIWVAMKRADRFGVGSKYAVDLSVMILIFSLVGARATYVVTHWSEFADHPLDAISPVQSSGQIGIAGLVLLGGVIAGFLTAWIYGRRHQVAFLTTTDVFVPSLALGIAIGRLGCFFNGCCFGYPSDLPWACVFPPDSLAGDVFPGLHVHPTQLYESAYMLLVFGGLLLADRRRKPLGMLTGIFLLLYGIGRFFVEMIRWYEGEMILIQSPRFTFSQLISAVMVVAGVVLMVRAKKRGVMPEAPVEPAPARRTER